MDQNEVNKLILDNLKTCTNEIKKVSADVTEIKVSQAGLHSEHTRMNTSLEEHIAGVKTASKRIDTLEDDYKARRAIKMWLKDKRTIFLFLLTATGGIAGILKYLKMF